MIEPDARQTARELLLEAHPALVGLSHWIHANPELGYEETLAAGWVADWMQTAGFDVRSGVAGMDTAIVATSGSGSFHVALCAEYDALPAVGHACGHNVIAASSVGAILEPEMVGVRQLSVTYTGREAHAAGFPELGINAADALTIAQVAIGLLRQHIPSGDRIHGIVTKGGDAPNIVPAHTTGAFMVRSHTREGLEVLTERVERCFEAGAIATGCELTIRREVDYLPVAHDPDLVEIYARHAVELGRWFDPDAKFVASTDMGDVSHVVPSIHPIIGIDSKPAVNHQPGFTDAAAGPAADQAVFDGALLLALTAIDAAQSAGLRARLTRQVVPESSETIAFAELGDSGWELESDLPADTADEPLDAASPQAVAADEPADDW